MVKMTVNDMVAVLDEATVERRLRRPKMDELADAAQGMGIGSYIRKMILEDEHEVGLTPLAQEVKDAWDEGYRGERMRDPHFASSRMLEMIKENQTEREYLAPRFPGEKKEWIAGRRSWLSAFRRYYKAWRFENELE